MFLNSAVKTLFVKNYHVGENFDKCPIDGSTARRCIAIVTNERRASYVIPLNSSWESRLKTP